MFHRPAVLSGADNVVLLVDGARIAQVPVAGLSDEEEHVRELWHRNDEDTRQQQAGVR